MSSCKKQQWMNTWTGMFKAITKKCPLILQASLSFLQTAIPRPYKCINHCQSFQIPDSFCLWMKDLFAESNLAICSVSSLTPCCHLRCHGKMPSHQGCTEGEGLCPPPPYELGRRALNSSLNAWGGQRLPHKGPVIAIESNVRAKHRRHRPISI